MGVQWCKDRDVPPKWGKALGTPNVSNQACPYCSRPLMKIDHYGEMLVGCIDCNRWGHPGDEQLIMELMESDLEALKASQEQS